MAAEPSQINRPRFGVRFGALAVALGAAVTSLSGAGCNLVAFIGGMASSAERTGSTEVGAKYTGLEGKTFAVVVAADRSIQGEYPEVVPLVTRDITRRLVDHCGASGVVPADDVLNFQYRRPGWVAMSPGELAKELEVERLVFIDFQDYTLTDAGNPYVWNGAASGVVNVLETDSATPDDFAFRENVRVKFPDNEGLSPLQVPRETVAIELARRFIHRSSWFFFDHEEPNIIKY